MKSKLLVGTLMVLGGFSLNAKASEIDCFPMCVEALKVEAKVESAADIKLDTINVVAQHDLAAAAPHATTCDSGLIEKAEGLNNKVKPIREIVGYVRSPQGLVIKLVNDYVVTIPVWVGYVMDPLGSIKRKAFDEARTLAKDAMADGNACATANESFETTDAINTKHSI